MDDDKLREMMEDSPEFSRRIRKLEDFRYDEVQEKFWDITTGTLLGGKSVDGAIPRALWPTKENAKGKLLPVRPCVAINDVMTGLTVESSTWWPGQPQFLEHRMVGERGAMYKRGAVTYNTYVPPDHSTLFERELPDPGPWIEHVKKLWPTKAEHEAFFDFAAHMIQRPDEKVNHGLVLAGAQGIGKDTAMHPLRKGVGEYNASEVDPDAVARQFNDFVKSVLLVINEVRPHDEDHKSSNFYNQLKPLLAAPPDMLPMRRLYQNVIYVRNLCHVILTTNEPLTMYIPKEDRRLCVLVSPLPDPKTHDVFAPEYFDRLWAFLRAEEEAGTQAVIRWLLERDLIAFDPTRPPPMTAGKRAIIESAHLIRRGPVDDLIEHYLEWCSENGFNRTPDVIFAKDFYDFIAATNLFDDAAKMQDGLRAKNFHFKMDEHGFDTVRNPYSAEWKRGNFRSRMAFVKKDVPDEDRYRIVLEELERRPLEFRL